MNAFYRFIIGLCAWLLLVAAGWSVLAELYRDAAICTAGVAALVVLWEWMARDGDRREQMRRYRNSVWERRLR